MAIFHAICSFVGLPHVCYVKLRMHNSAEVRIQYCTEYYCIPSQSSPSLVDILAQDLTAPIKIKSHKSLDCQTNYKVLKRLGEVKIRRPHVALLLLILSAS